MNSKSKPLRIGAVSFLNSIPLIEGLDEHPRVQLSRDLPARLADQLADDQIDVGLIPVVEYLRGVGRDLVPGICISSRGPVRTVKVFSRVPLEEATEIAVDRGSRSSVALLRVLLAERFGTSPDLHVIEPRPESLFTHYSSVLVIGDRADQTDPTGLHVYDLGGLWYEMTGLPMVFAAWVTSERMSELEQAEDRRAIIDLLQAARDRGAERIVAIGAREAEQRGLDPHFVHSYFREHVRFSLGEAELAGLQRFAELAAEHHLVPAQREVSLAEA